VRSSFLLRSLFIPWQAPQAFSYVLEFAVSISREIPSDHLGPLQRLIGQKPDSATGVFPELPKKVYDKYWDAKFCADRVGLPLVDRDFLTIALLCGYGQPTAEQLAPPTIQALWDAKVVSRDSAVKVKWRNKKVDGKLVRVTDDGRVFVTIGEDTTEHELTVADVTVAA